VNNRNSRNCPKRASALNCSATTSILTRAPTNSRNDTITSDEVTLQAVLGFLEDIITQHFKVIQSPKVQQCINAKEQRLPVLNSAIQSSSRTTPNE
jgi:hypothetical protein